MKNKVWVLTHFPHIFESFKKLGVVREAFNNLVELNPILIADYVDKGLKGIDSAPYGGGEGMVLRADSLKQALERSVLIHYDNNWRKRLTIITTGPRGQRWNSKAAESLKEEFLDGEKDFVFICGRYEGIDQRFIDKYIDRELSIGDFILSGGDLAVLTILDSTLRLFDGVLGNKESAKKESFNNNLLEHSQYTRPQVFEGLSVPDVLLSGNHQKINEFRESESLEITKKLRPDLLSRE